VRDLETAGILDPALREHALGWKLRNEEFIMAELGDSIVGYLRLDYMWPKIPYIGLIMVKAELRSHESRKFGSASRPILPIFCRDHANVHAFRIPRNIINYLR
jgi:hypothetical protein